MNNGNWGSGENLILFIFSLTEKNTKVTPPLPQRGRQPKGSIPLTPFYDLVNLMSGNRNVGDAQAAGAEVKPKPPRAL